MYRIITLVRKPPSPCFRVEIDLTAMANIRSTTPLTRMDTAAYLTGQGWRGNGHALHHSGRGITKPIAISKKTDVLGIGKKKHDAHADQWWARAFDETLKDLNTKEDGITGKTQGVSIGTGAQALQMVRKGGSKWVGQSALYANFVRGETLGGTLMPRGNGVSVVEERPQGETPGIDSDGIPNRGMAKAKGKGSKRTQRPLENHQKHDVIGKDVITVWSHSPSSAAREVTRVSDEVTRKGMKQKRRRRTRELEQRKVIEHQDADVCESMVESPNSTEAVKNFERSNPRGRKDVIGAAYTKHARPERHKMVKAMSELRTKQKEKKRIRQHEAEGET